MHSLGLQKLLSPCKLYYTAERLWVDYGTTDRKCPPRMRWRRTLLHPCVTVALGTTAPLRLCCRYPGDGPAPTALLPHPYTMPRTQGTSGNSLARNRAGIHPSFSSRNGRPLRSSGSWEFDSSQPGNQTPWPKKVTYRRAWKPLTINSFDSHDSICISPSHLDTVPRNQ